MFSDVTLAATYSWIFCAIGLGPINRPAQFQDIVEVADGINHAIPTSQEFDSSIDWLELNSLIKCYGEAYELTSKGKDILGETSRDVFSIMKAVEEKFVLLGVDDLKHN